MQDLEEAIKAAQQAVDSTPVDRPGRAGRLNNLGNNLCSRYERTGQMQGLEEAIKAAQQAVVRPQPRNCGRIILAATTFGPRLRR
jgi:hypothetical protein